MKAIHPSISQISGFPSGVPTPKNTHVKKRCHSYRSPLQFFSGVMTFLQNKFLDEVWKHESNKNPSVIVEWGRRGLVTPLQGPLVMVTLNHRWTLRASRNAVCSLLAGASQDGRLMSRHYSSSVMMLWGLHLRGSFRIRHFHHMKP